MEQFCKTIELIKSEFALRQDAPLYDICRNDLHPWGNERHLTVKLRIISMECGNPLYKGFIRFDKNKKPIESYSFKGNVDELYLFVSRYLLSNAADTSNMLSSRISFVDNMEEIKGVLSDSVDCVLLLANLLTQAVREYNLKFVDNFDPNTTLPSFIRLSSAILHCHFPNFVLQYKGSAAQFRKLFSDKWDCAINGDIISDRVKEELFSIFVLPSNHLRQKFIPEYNPHTTFWTLDYVNYCAHAYALGCFIKKNISVDDGMNVGDLVSEIFCKIKV